MHLRCCTTANNLMGKFTRKRCERRTPIPALVEEDDILPQLRTSSKRFQITLVTHDAKLWCKLLAGQQRLRFHIRESVRLSVTILVRPSRLDRYFSVDSRIETPPRGGWPSDDFHARVRLLHCQPTSRPARDRARSAGHGLRSRLR